MPSFQLGDTSKVAYSLVELDADGNPAPPLSGDVITIVSSDTASLTVVPDTVPVAGSVASGFLVAGKKLGSVTVTATINHQQSTIPPLTVVDTIDVVASAASSISLGLGSPVAQ
jgi:hypothetical protein